MANTTNRTTRIKHVYGNVLKLAIPLTLRTVTLEGGIVEVTDTDYTPSNHYPVVVQFVNGPLKYELDATIRDNYIAVVEDKGTIPVGNYAIVVLCKDDNGDPRRFKQRCVLEVVDVTADAGIEVGIEFEAQEWLLDGAIFLAIKGEDGIDGVGIESITTDETSVSGEYNQVTFHLTNGSSYTLNVRNGESTEQTLPANVVVDENYVHTDNNYTDTDKQKIESVDKLFGDAEYDRISRRLNFFKHGDTMHTNPLKSIDITDFIRDSRVSSFRIVDGNLTIKLNSDGNNEEFKVPITSINANYYTKSQVDSLYSSLSSRVTPVEVIFTESNDSITSNRTINGIYTDYTNKKPIIGRYGNSVGTLLYISSQEAAFIFGDRYDKPFILRNSGSTHWGKEDLVDDSSSIVIDDAPTPESNNAVSSGSVWYYLTQRIQSVTINGTTKTPDDNGNVNFTVQGGGGYTPPQGGIPKTDLASGVQSSLDAADSAYQKPNGGIPASDLSSAVQTSLGKADTALQSSDLDGYATTDDVDDAVAALVSSAPQTLDTLKELADALGDDPNFATTMATQLGNKVDKETGKGLSTNDYTTAEKTKLAGIAAGAEVNVQPNWTQTNTSADDYIKNKPTIPTKVSDLTNDSGFTSNAGTITGITMNGTSKGTSGVVDLGTVITAHQDISGKANASDVYTKTQTDTLLASKQDTLTASDTLATINGTPLYYGGSVTVQGEKGDKGDTGNVQVDGNGNVLIYNGRDKTTTGAALDAYQGQFLGKMLNAKDNAFYNVWVGTQTEFDTLSEISDDTIYLVGIVPTLYTVTNTLTHVTKTNTAAKVLDGKGYTSTLAGESGYTIDSVSVVMGSTDITSTAYTAATGVIEITSVNGNIVITAVATKHISSITISAGSSVGNTILLTANTGGADNVTLQWSIDDTTNFSITDNNNGTATLYIEATANNDDVTITCTDTNQASGTATGTLQLTGLSYEQAPVSSITNITAQRTAANTLSLTAVTDQGNKTDLAFSVVGTVPKVKSLNREASPMTLDDVNAVEISGNTLSYKDYVEVTLIATANIGTVDEVSSSNITIDIEDYKPSSNNNDAIWFEDEVTLAALNSNSVGSGGKVTYTQAAAVTALKFLAGNTSIRRFKEFMWFTGITGIGINSSDKSNFKGCSNLECLGIPMGTNGFYTNASASSNTGLTGCNLKEIHVRNIDDIFRVSHWNSSGFSSFYYAGRNSNGLGLYVDNAEVTDIVVPSTRTSVGNFKLAGFNRITSFTAHDDVTSIGEGVLAGCAALTSIKIGNGLTSFGTNMIRYNQLIDYITTLNSVDLGTACSSLGTQCFRGCTGLRTITLRYDGVVTQDNSFYQAASMSSIDLYVPANQVSAYQAASPWSGAKSINAITE